MEFDGDYHAYFGDDNPELLAFDGLQQKYTKDDNIFIVLTAKNGDVFTKENLLAIEELTAKAWKTPFSTHVDEITNFQHTIGLTMMTFMWRIYHLMKWRSTPTNSSKKKRDYLL